jgi:hypothetical protein
VRSLDLPLPASTLLHDFLRLPFLTTVKPHRLPSFN